MLAMKGKEKDKDGLTAARGNPSFLEGLETSVGWLVDLGARG